jgi:NAD(P)-dependent dehydrogenase (short-subunit alcohol dehydrogenase family)
MKDLNGKTAVITGGATGIGLALALELTKEGVKVVLASTNKERLEEAAQTIKDAGGEAFPVMIYPASFA